MNETNYVVYRHTSPSGRVYIGITCKKPENRWSNGNGYKNQKLFYNAIQKYGWDNFKHEILFSDLSEISAKLIEIDLIYYYKSLNLSYNITDGGDGTRGYKPTEEARKKMSDSKKGKRKGKNNSFYGKHHSAETKEKISKANKLKNIGRSSWNKGKHHSAETKEKISKANKKPVNQYSKDGKLIATYNSLKEAERDTMIRYSNISACCKERQKTAGGFIWKYKS